MSSETKHRLVLPAYILLCLIWGSTWAAIRVIVRDVPPIRAAALRFVFGALALLIAALIQRYPLPKTAHEWRAVLVLSITMMAVPYGLLFWAEQYVLSSMTAVLYASLPLMVALMTPLMTGKSVPRVALYSLLVAVGGIAVLFNLELRTDANTLLGGAFILVSVACSGYSAIYARREIPTINPVVSTGLQLGIGSLFLLLSSLVMERNQESHWTRSAIIALLFLATFGSAIAFAVYYWLLRYMPAYKATTISLIVPFVAIIEGLLLLHERITLMMLVCSVVVLGAVALVMKAEADESTRLRLLETPE